MTTTRFYNAIKLEGQYIDLPYGSYTLAQISVLPGSIMSINMPRHALVTLYSQNNFAGVALVIPNYGNKSLKITGFAYEFPYTVQSLTIECACKLNNYSNVIYQITTTSVAIGNQPAVAYTFYNVNPEPMKSALGPPSPYNPTILIIPDFGTDMTAYAWIQGIFALHRFSSIVLDLGGISLSSPTTDNTYATIIQNYRYIAQLLNQYTKKPIVIGHGVGGAIAQLWSLTYKFELRKLILIDTAPYAVYTTYNLLNTTIQNWISNSITTSAFATAVVNATYNTKSEDCQNAKLKLDLTNSITSADPTSLKLLFTQNPDVPSLANAPKFILVRTLIIHGLYDDSVDLNGGHTLHNLIKHSRYIKIGAGHSPQFTTADRIIEAIIQFLLDGKKLYMDPVPVQ